MTAGDEQAVLVSIIIPVYNGEATLTQCLMGCLAQSVKDHEIIVVDDGSTDGTGRIAQAFPVKYVRQENAGPAAARNRGAAEARGKVLAFTDADCIPEPNWAAELLKMFRRGVVAVGGTYSIANGESPLARIIHGEISMRHDAFDEEVDFLGSFNVAYLKEDFDAVGGFDESFTMASGEDNDLAYRLLERGRLKFTPRARVAHFHPTRVWPYLRAQMWHGFWRVKLYQKHPERRKAGDRYAGKADLFAPPVLVASLLCMLGFAAAAAVQITVLQHLPLVIIPGTAIVILAFVYGALRIPMALKLARWMHDRRMLYYTDVAVLRDAARALGMLRGFWHFGIRRKKSL